MALKPETKFRQRFMKKIDKLPYSWFESIQQKTIRGTPDVLGLIGGKFIALEFKASKNSPITELQKYKLTRIEQSGGVGFVVYPENEKEIISYLKHVVEHI
jgi:hypothetical protein